MQVYQHCFETMSRLVRYIVPKKGRPSVSIKPFSNYSMRYFSARSEFQLMVEKDSRRVFESTFPHFLNSVIREEDPRLEPVMQHFKEVMEYNVPQGKKVRGITAVMTYQMLTQSKQVPKEEIYLVHLMGWCIETLQAFLLVEDDIMDQSLTRRGRQCWYRKKDVGLVAINDGLFLGNTIFKILKKYFRDHSYYINIMELFHEAQLKTLYGQSMDTRGGTKFSPREFQKYTAEHYATIAEYKTSYYSFYLPVAVALYMCGITDPNTHAQAKDILLLIGHYFQIQDDFLDCFGDPNKTGKIGNDIKEGKCTWLIVTALEKADAEQRKVLENNYGQETPDCEACVVKVFNDLKLPELYKEYEQQTINRITSLISLPHAQLPSSIFTFCLNQIYKRTS